MVARAWGERIEGKRWRPEARGIAKSAATASRTAGGIEERFVQNEAVSVCLLINRRTKTMRVIDFRAGPSHAKRLFLLKLAEREGIEKIYTVVEKDEVPTWVTLGFSKEANIPGFYRRSDAFLLGTSVASAALGVGVLLPAALQGDDEDAALVTEASPAHDAVDKTLVQARKQVKSLLDRQLPPMKLAQVTEGEILKALDKALRTGRALTAFEPFGRDVERRYFQLTARSGFELIASTESQSCFGNAFLELLTAPSTEHERLATIRGLRVLCDELADDGVASCFALSPSDDVALATAFVWSGFRRTGLLAGHMLVSDARKDAIVWSRRLASTTVS